MSTLKISKAVHAFNTRAGKISESIANAYQNLDILISDLTDHITDLEQKLANAASLAVSHTSRIAELEGHVLIAQDQQRKAEQETAELRAYQRRLIDQTSVITVAPRVNQTFADMSQTYLQKMQTLLAQAEAAYAHNTSSDNLKWVNFYRREVALEHANNPPKPAIVKRRKH